MIDSDRRTLVEAVDRYGVSPLSFLLRYRAPWRSFVGGDGVVCYLESPRAATAWSDPLCRDEKLATLVRDYAQAMRDERRGICFVAVNDTTARVALAAGFSVLKVGEEPWFDLASWQQPRGDRGKKLRWAVNHAHRAGLAVEEYRPDRGRDRRLDADVLDVLARWQAALGRPESTSLLGTAPLELAELKRIFVARRNGSAEAVLSCARLPAVNGWYLEDLIRAPQAVNGATELLVVEALRRLAADGAACAAFALAPMRGVDRQLDPRARWLAPLLALAIRGFDRRYRFHSIARYEARFGPSEWRARHIAFLPALPRPATVRAAVRALSA